MEVLPDLSSEVEASPACKPCLLVFQISRLLPRKLCTRSPIAEERAAVISLATKMTDSFKTQAVQAFNTEGLSLDKFLEYQVANSGWVLEKGNGRSQLIALPRNECNHLELRRNNADGIPLEHVTRIFGVLV
ncbi:Eukaryotic translation initiation factor 3 subunit K [Platanthera guangdongensis]|uniref:Eukaryotic translation initiation factor 3 subunit K n=1 Tax=Platanthera guangdongensis TaxID=2320717 RepID=A0ABR2MXN2_9ASPA